VDYQTTLQGWHTFATTAAGAAASLTGLLFVGLSLHLRLVVARSDVRALARVTFTGFVLLLLLALFLVVPNISASTIGWALIGSGLAAGALTLPSLISAATGETHTVGLRRLLLRFALSMAAFLSVIIAGCIFVSGAYRPALDFLAATIIVILVVSLRNSWDLLVSTASAAPPGAHAEESR